MKAEDNLDSGFGSAKFFKPQPSPSAPRRLSSCFSEPSRPMKPKRQLAWVNLQGRLIGAEEASSARGIGGGLSPDEAVAWELFTPIQRVLVVAVIAVASANSKRNKRILELQKSVQLRDEVLFNMQQKLDKLCEELNYFKDQPEPGVNGCWLCEQHKNLPKQFSMSDLAKKMSMGENEAEPEERRMSDLSDLAPSVASSVDIQVNNLTIYQDFYNLQRESEEKEATIKKLSTRVQSSEAFGSKRISELEDIIRRKNMIISKLRKDILVLEQKVTKLTRHQRPSFSAASSSFMQLPVLTDNIVYDMDSASPSSSDSDNSPRNKPQAAAAMNLKAIRNSGSDKDQKKSPRNVPQTPAAKNLEAINNSGTEEHQKSSLRSEPQTPAALNIAAIKNSGTQQDQKNSPRNEPRTPAALNLEAIKSSGSERGQKNSPRNEPQTPAAKNSGAIKSAEREKKSATVRVTERHYSPRPTSPLKEIALNQSGYSVSGSKPKQTSSGKESTSSRRPPVKSKLSNQKRWAW